MPDRTIISEFAMDLCKKDQVPCDMSHCVVGLLCAEGYAGAQTMLQLRQ